MTNKPTIQRLHEVLEYDPNAGVFRWKIARKHCTKGAVAGRLQKNGYIFIGIDGNKWGAHRIAWAMYYGEWANQLLDHANCNKQDNRISNIRLADKSKNAHNAGAQKRNTSGFKCVYWNSQCNRWMAKTTIKGKVYYIGLFDTKEAAHEAYANFAKQHLGEFARAA